MKELTKIAKNYAAEKTNDVMVTAIAQAYADGYRDGYRDREEEIPVNLRNNETEYVDLGLPSGTLWAADYEKEDGSIMYSPYTKASTLNIPTEEQWNELLETCRWEYKTANVNKNKHFICVGLNGNCIKFSYNGVMKDGENPENFSYARFWIKNEQNDSEKNAIYIHGELSKDFYWKHFFEKKPLYMGYKIPIRLVRK